MKSFFTTSATTEPDVPTHLFFNLVTRELRQPRCKESDKKKQAEKNEIVLLNGFQEGPAYTIMPNATKDNASLCQIRPDTFRAIFWELVSKESVVVLQYNLIKKVCTFCVLRDSTVGVGRNRLVVDCENLDAVMGLMNKGQDIAGLIRQRRDAASTVAGSGLEARA